MLDTLVGVEMVSAREDRQVNIGWFSTIGSRDARRFRAKIIWEINR
jgi:hypothetical protein